MNEIMRLKELLKEKGVSAKELAAGIGVHAVTISSIAQNKSIPSKENLINIAEYLDVDIRDLFHSSKQNSKEEIITKAQEIVDYLKETK